MKTQADVFLIIFIIVIIVVGVIIIDEITTTTTAATTTSKLGPISPFRPPAKYRCFGPSVTLLTLRTQYYCVVLCIVFV
jgi:hypothetical protein